MSTAKSFSAAEGKDIEPSGGAPNGFIGRTTCGVGANDVAGVLAIGERTFPIIPKIKDKTLRCGTR